MVGQYLLHSANDGQTQASEGLASPTGTAGGILLLPSLSSPLFPPSLTTDSLSYSYQPLSSGILPFAHRVLSFHSRCQLHSFSCTPCCPFFLYPVPSFHRVWFAYPTTRTRLDSTRPTSIRQKKENSLIRPYTLFPCLVYSGLDLFLKP